LAAAENQGLHKSCPEIRALRQSAVVMRLTHIRDLQLAIKRQRCWSRNFKAQPKRRSPGSRGLDSRIAIPEFVGIRHTEIYVLGTHCIYGEGSGRNGGGKPPTTGGSILKLHYLPLIKPTESRMSRVCLGLQSSVYSVEAWDFTQIPIPAARAHKKKHWQLIVSPRFGQ